MAILRDVYILTGDYYGDVSYGVDMSSYIFGIFTTEEEAQTAMERLKGSEELFEDENGNRFFENWGEMTVYDPDEEEFRKEVGKPEPEFVRVKDFLFSIVHYADRPKYIAGAGYLE